MVGPSRRKEITPHAPRALRRAVPDPLRGAAGQGRPRPARRLPDVPGRQSPAEFRAGGRLRPEGVLLLGPEGAVGGHGPRRRELHCGPAGTSNPDQGGAHLRRQLRTLVANCRPATVVDLRTVRLSGRARRRRSERLTGATRAHQPPGPAQRRAGDTAHPPPGPSAEDLGAVGGRPPHRRSSHQTRPGHGRGHGPRRTAALRGVRRRRQRRPSAHRAHVTSLLHHRGRLSDRGAPGRGRPRLRVRGVEGQAPGAAAVGLWPRRDPRARPRPGRAQPRQLSRAAPHLLHEAPGSGHGPRSRPGPGRPCLDRDHPALSAPGRRLVGRRIPPGERGHRRPGAGGGAVTVIVPAADLRPLSLTISDYLAQISLSLRPDSVRSIGSDLRMFLAFLAECHPEVATVADLERRHVERYKAHMASTAGRKGPGLASATVRRRLSTLRMLFERITEWDWEEAPLRPLVFAGDFPKRDEALPKFLDDATFVRFMAAARSEPRPLLRLAIELLARTGMRVGELCGLETDAMVQIGDGHWLRIPVGKLHNDSYIPLHPQLVDMLGEWAEHPDCGVGGRLLTNDGRPLNRHAVVRMLNRVTKKAGIAHVHPHQLRHTVATQAVNNGMSLDAIAALLGHRSMYMTIDRKSTRLN